MAGGVTVAQFEAMGKNKGGRPRIWKDPKVIADKIEAYRLKCEKEDKPFHLSGLALALGTTRTTLVNYSEKGEFLAVIKRARTIAEAAVEDRLFSKASPVGAIFVAKNGYGWKDKHEIEMSGSVDINGFINKMPGGDSEELETGIDALEGEIVGENELLE